MYGLLFIFMYLLILEFQVTGQTTCDLTLLNKEAGEKFYRCYNFIENANS